MRVERVHIVEAVGAYYNDDQEAIRNGAVLDGMFYDGDPVTPGFKAIRAPAAAVSIGLMLDNGYLAWGDAVAVQYSGVGGRDRYRCSRVLKEEIESRYADTLYGLDVTDVRKAHQILFGPSCVLGKEPLETGETYIGTGAASAALSDAPASIRYGLSQAILSAAAGQHQELCVQTICREYDLPLPTAGIPIFGQSGDARYDNVDRMILRQLDVLPHGLINHVDLVGADGDKLLSYVAWVARRIQRYAPSDYRPTLHIDTYGCIGRVFGLDTQAMVRFLTQLRAAAQPYSIQVEAVADFGSREKQIEGYASLRHSLAKAGCDVRLVIDEWCNNGSDVQAFIAADAADVIQLKLPDMGTLVDAIEAILLCRRSGVGAYVGGSCAETDLSARVSVHVALATRAEMMLAKPGMGVDEGHMIVANEQSRCLSLLHAHIGG